MAPFEARQKRQQLQHDFDEATQEDSRRIDFLLGPLEQEAVDAQHPAPVSVAYPSICKVLSMVGEDFA